MSSVGLAEQDASGIGVRPHKRVCGHIRLAALYPGWDSIDGIYEDI
jgi:hypothetical protein